MKWNFGLFRIERSEGTVHPVPPPPQDDSTSRIRAGTYTLLGELLSFPPDADRLDSLARINLARAGEHLPLESQWKGLRKAAACTGWQAATGEYRSLFAWGGTGPIVPFASWYMTGELTGPPLAELRFDLMSLGIEPREGSCATEDHVGSLCDAMGMIVACPEEFDPEWQQRLFRKYLDPWIRRFFNDLRDAPAARFYRAVAEFGLGFIEMEQRRFVSPH